MRITFFIVIMLSSFQLMGQRFSGTLNGGISIHLLLGTQLKAVNVGLSLFGTTTHQSNTAIEGGVNFNFSPFIQKYGVYQSNFSSSIEFFGLVGYGKNNNLLGANVGLTQHTSFYDYTVKDEQFYGLGAVVILNKIKGNLSKFENKQGGVILRGCQQQNSIAFNMVNDMHAFFFQSGSDKGSTARALLSYTTIKGGELYGLGVGMDMFTPEANYGKAPRGTSNDEDGMMAVLINTQPYDDLFHFNLFTAVVYQHSDHNISIDGRVGVDNYKLGAFVQNAIHDNFGWFPRFSWPVHQKGKLYTLFDINTALNKDF